jgi:hypothetical protein
LTGIYCQALVEYEAIVRQHSEQAEQDKWTH